MYFLYLQMYTRKHTKCNTPKNDLDNSLYCKKCPLQSQQYSNET